MIAAIKPFFLAVLAAAVAGILGVLTLALLHIWINGGSHQAFAAMGQTPWVLLFVYSMVSAALCLALVVVPITAALSRLGFNSPAAYALVGLVVGLAAAHVFATPVAESYRYEILLFLVAVGAVPGCAAGIVWWRLFGRSKASRLDRRV